MQGNIVIGGITGGSVSIGGNVRSTEGFAETQAGGAVVKYQPGESLSSRQVTVNGIGVVLMRGGQTQASINGLNIRSNGVDNLWVNGDKVDFGAGKVEPQKSPAERLAEIQGRFPGVQFVGDLAGVFIGDEVKIAPGAHIELTPNLSIDGETTIGPKARVSGGEISYSKIDGSVSGGNVSDTTVAEGAFISGGVVKDSKLAGGARITDGVVKDTKLDANAVISGGVVKDSRLGEGARITDGVVKDVTLKPGEVISGGVHKGRVGAQQGASIVIGDVTVGAGDRFALDNVSSGVTILGRGNVVVRQHVGNVAPGETVAGLVIDKLG